MGERRRNRPAELAAELPRANGVHPISRGRACPTLTGPKDRRGVFCAPREKEWYRGSKLSPLVWRRLLFLESNGRREGRARNTEGVMAMDYNRIEEKWQKKWEDAGSFHASEDHGKKKLMHLSNFRIRAVPGCTSDT